MHKSSSNIISFFFYIISLVVLFYFWLPLFIIIFIASVFYFLIMSVLGKVSGHPSKVQVKIIKIKRTLDSSSKEADYIDTTTSDKDQS